VLEPHDGQAGEHERRDVGKCHQGVQQRPLLVQVAQRLRRHFRREITLELPRVLVVVGRHVRGA
jgi:hypothetical protein